MLSPSRRIFTLVWWTFDTCRLIFWIDQHPITCNCTCIFNLSIWSNTNSCYGWLTFTFLTNLLINIIFSALSLHPFTSWCDFLIYFLMYMCRYKSKHLKPYYKIIKIRTNMLLDSNLQVFTIKFFYKLDQMCMKKIFKFQICKVKKKLLNLYFKNPKTEN